MLAHEFVDEHLPRLTPSAGVLAVYIARHTIGTGKTAVRKRLSDVMSGTGLSERTIRRCVAELAHVVAVHHEPGKAPIWDFLIAPQQGGQNCHPPGRIGRGTPCKIGRGGGQNCRG